MIERELKIKYAEFSSLEELETDDRLLAQSAIEAIAGAYAPYSHFHVGAAVRMSGGAVVKGANQENAAYPSGLCAERTAMFAAGAAYPDQNMVSIAVAAEQNGHLCPSPAAPCGACRQVMAQYQTKSGLPIPVILVGSEKILKFSCVDDLLPFIFDNI